MSWIRINQQLFQFAEIAQLTDQELGAMDAYAQKVLGTARKWLRNETHFELATSGSTGKPKIFTFNREQIRQSAGQTVKAFGLEKGDVLLHCLSMDSVAGFMMLMRGLIYEMPLEVLEPKSNPLDHLNENHSYAFAAMVPLQLETVLEENSSLALLHQMKAIILGGAPVSRALQQKIGTMDLPVYQTYGMTETLTHVAIRPLWPKADQPYKALPGVSFATDDRHCLAIYTPLYEALVQTNDVVHLQDAHTFYWKGRYDNVINSGGFKIQVEVVEKAVEAAWPGHAEGALAFFVAGIPDETLGEKAILVVECGDWDEQWEAPLMASLKKQLHAYEVPKVIHQVDEFAYTATGKLDRKSSLKGLTLI